jgi:hypothetical protein
MGNLLKALFTGLLGGSLKTILAGAGIGLASAAIAMSIITYYIDQTVAAAGGLGTFASLLGIAGFDIALSIIFSAIVLKITLNSASLALRKLK